MTKKKIPKSPLSKDPALEVISPPRRRDRDATLHQLHLALSRVQRRGKVTLKAVAEEAKVSPPLINNRYPDFAEQVRAIMGKTIRQQRNDKAGLLVAERAKNRKLRELIGSQLVEITKLASVNAALRMEVVILKGIAEGKVARGSFGQKVASNKM